MIVLGLDVGVITGYATASVENGIPVVEIDDCGDMDYRKKELDVPKLLKSIQPDAVVVEYPLLKERGAFRQQLQEIVKHVEDSLSTFRGEVLVIEPGKWKPHPQAKKPFPNWFSVHARDAMRMVTVAIAAHWLKGT